MAGWASPVPTRQAAKTHKRVTPTLPPTLPTFPLPSPILYCPIKRLNETNVWGKSRRVLPMGLRIQMPYPPPLTLPCRCCTKQAAGMQYVELHQTSSTLHQGAPLPARAAGRMQGRWVRCPPWGVVGTGPAQQGSQAPSCLPPVTEERATHHADTSMTNYNNAKQHVDQALHTSMTMYKR